MTPYLYAAVGLAVLAVIAYPVLTYLIDKPERRHRRPPWWQRIRDRRLEERARDALNVRLIHDISEGIKRESTGRTSSGMPRADWPLQPLPEGAEEYADHFHRPLPAEVAGERECRCCGCVTAACQCDCCCWEYAEPYEDYVEPEDPLDVATPEQVADAYVGLAGQPGKNGSDGAGLIGPPPMRSLPSPAPEPEPCRAPMKGIYGVDTLCQRPAGHAGEHHWNRSPAEWPAPEPVPMCCTLGPTILGDPACLHDSGHQGPHSWQAGPEPDPVVLTDFREQTGSWEALVDAVIPKDGA